MEKQDYLTEILADTFPDVAVPLFFREKTSFGDIDIICSWPQDIEGKRGEWLRDYIEETFKPGQIYHNGNSWSFNIEELQVDLIMCQPEHFNSFYHYFSYNDLGNLMGRIAHGLGLKYAQEGLVYDHYFKDIKIGRVLVSKDYPQIFKFLDLDYKRWEEGFDTLEDVFAYVVGSKYFSYDRYQLETLNRINRERNLKRDSYFKFLEYIENYKDRIYDFPEKKVSVKRADKFFPEFNLNLETRRMEYEYTRKLYIKAKFNGGMLITEFGIHKMDVNDYMSRFIGMADSKEEYEKWVLESDRELILREFKRLMLKP